MKEKGNKSILKMLKTIKKILYKDLKNSKNQY